MSGVDLGHSTIFLALDLVSQLDFDNDGGRPTIGDFALIDTRYAFYRTNSFSCILLATPRACPEVCTV